MQSLQQIRDDLDSQVVEKILGRDVTRAELSAAFDKVAPKGHWKNRIDAQVVLGSDFDKMLVASAIVFFTGSVASFEMLRVVTPISASSAGENLYRVRAAGYYATIGA